MTSPAVAALNLLSIIRQETDVIGVAVSFGKDSLATLDLCCRMFSRVEAYYLYRVRGLRAVEEWAKQVRDRHGVRVRMYPHFDLVRLYRHAILQPRRSAAKTLVAKAVSVAAGAGAAGLAATFNERAILAALLRGVCSQDSSRMDGYGPASPTLRSDQEDRLVAF